jgi:hypothetical protein
MCMVSPHLPQTFYDCAWFHHTYPKPSMTVHGFTTNTPNLLWLCMVSPLIPQTFYVHGFSTPTTNLLWLCMVSPHLPQTFYVHGFTTPTLNLLWLCMVSPHLPQTFYDCAWFHHTYPKPSMTVHGFTTNTPNLLWLCMVSPHLPQTFYDCAWFRHSYSKPSITAFLSNVWRCSHHWPCFHLLPPAGRYIMFGVGILPYFSSPPLKGRFRRYSLSNEVTGYKKWNPCCPGRQWLIRHHPLLMFSTSCWS